MVLGQQSNDLKLWYYEPSGETWENALPIANSRIGSMVYGNVPKDIFQLNEHTFWSGSPNRNDNLNALAALPEVRQLIFDSEYKTAEQLAKKITFKKSQGQMFQPVGNLELTFPGHENFHDYYRDLNISDAAVSKTSYKVDGITYSREAFVSLADRVLVIKLSADQLGKISFTSNFTSPHLDPN